MTVELALERLVRLVREDFEAAGSSVPNLFGWRKLADKTVTGVRVIWIPGDDTSGDLGAHGPARHPGRLPRPIGTLYELATVYLVAADHASPTNEGAQYRTARLLFDAWHAAVYRAARGTFELLSSRWEIGKKERPFGAAIRIVLAVQAMLPDDADHTAITGAGAEIVPRLSDTTDPTVSIPVPPEPQP